MGARLPRILAASAGAVVLSALLAVQAGSSVLTRKQPELSSRLLPVNGLALEQQATRQFMSAVKERDDLVPSAQAASPAALSAISRDPLSPKAYAVLAVAEQNSDRKRALLDAASKLNRRDLLLQGLVLEESVAQKNYAATLATLDMILSVHPEQKANFFPILLQALSEKDALPALSGILDQESEWQEDFFKFAVRKPEVLTNLAELRLQRASVSLDVDQRLISGLASAGQLDKAYEVYRAANGQSAPASGKRMILDWRARLSPFDWELADEAGFRAQPSATPDKLEVFVRGGKGGVLASRNVRLASGPVALRINHDLTPPVQVEDVRLQLSCPGAEQPFYDEPLRLGSRDYRIGAKPAACDFVTIAIHARAWTGSSAIRGIINRIEILGS